MHSTQRRDAGLLVLLIGILVILLAVSVLFGSSVLR